MRQTTRGPGNCLQRHCRDLAIAHGGQKLAVLFGMLLGISLVIPSLRHMRIAFSLHQRFTGQSNQPFMVRGSLKMIETLTRGWLPTRAVNFKRNDQKGDTHTAFLFPDETLTNLEAAYALFDPFVPRRNWLIRHGQETPK